MMDQLTYRTVDLHARLSEQRSLLESQAESHCY